MTEAQASATDAARADAKAENGSLVIVLSGDWSLERAQPKFREVVGDESASRDKVRTLSFDSSELGEWDSSLLIFLVQCQDYCDEHKLELDTAGLPEQVPRLLALARAVPERAQAKEPERLPFVARVGTTVLEWWKDILAAIAFTGEVLIAIGGLFTRRFKIKFI